MKNLLFLPLAVCLLASCSKEQTKPEKSSCTQDPNANARLFQDFNYVLSVDAEGNYSCPTPKVDCTKISPNPTLALSIDAAIANGTVQNFFNQDDWAVKFPYLKDLPAVVAGLQNGDYTMLRKTNTDDNNIFYIVVSTADNAQTIHATMVDASL
ncbi:MAG: hypothetical protein ACRCYO_00730 [Bacteroidia bacterium]